VIRQHDVQVLSEDSEVLAEGTFRIVLTRGRRVLTAIDLPDSALGPLHLVFAVSPQSMMATTFATGSVFGDIGHAFGHAAHDVGHGLEKAAQGTFDVASKVATTLARPAFDITRDAAAAGAHLVAHLPFVAPSEREKIEAASRTVMRARLGDVNAQQFIRAVGEAAKAGVKAARDAGDALLTGTKIVAHVLDAPLTLIEKIPVVGGVLRATDPFVKMDHMAGALQRGDFTGLKNMIEGDIKMAQGVVSLIPGIGTGVSAAISAGMAVLDGDGPLDVAIHTAYGAIPIPPGIREVTDTVLGSVLSLLHRGSITDAALAGARNATPPGIPRDVFDTLVKLIVHHTPIKHVAEDLVGTYVKRYAPEISIPASIAEAAKHAASVNVGGGRIGAAIDIVAKPVGGKGGPTFRAPISAIGRLGALPTAPRASHETPESLRPSGALGAKLSLAPGGHGPGARQLVALTSATRQLGPAVALPLPVPPVVAQAEQVVVDSTTLMAPLADLAPPVLRLPAAPPDSVKS
jgi:hypothetical protein